MRYSQQTIDEVRQASDIVDVISGYVQLKRKGRNYFGLCPFHNEKSPSFAVSPDKQIFHCFGCNEGGNVFTFLSKIENLGFVETIQMLAEKANMNIVPIDNNQDMSKEILKAKVYKVNEFAAQYYHENLYKPQSKVAQEYIKQRKLTNNTLKAFQLGFSGKFDELYKELIKNGFEEQEILESGLVNKNDNGTYIDRYRNRLMFPICDARGKVIGFGGRVLDDSKPKYINSPENLVYNKSRNLYGLNVAKKSDTKKIIIVEGYMDVISLYQRGITNVVAPLGTALTTNQGWLLRNNSEQVVISFDSDEAGKKAKLRAVEILQEMGIDIRILNIEGAKDPDEYIIKYGNARFNNIVEKAMSVVEFKVSILKSELDLENTSDKIKFLNQIAKLISKVSNTMEKEIYIEKIAHDYNISKEAIYSEVNKLIYSENKLEKNQEPVKNIPQVSNQNNIKIKVSDATIKRENTIIYMLLTENTNIFELIKQNIKEEDFKYELNNNIVKVLYEEFEKGNSNINGIIDTLEKDEQNHISSILIEDHEIKDIEKAIDNILTNFTKGKLTERKLEILNLLDIVSNDEEKSNLEKELNQIIIEMAKIK